MDIIDEKTAENRIRELSKKLEEHNYRYYVLNDPIVSDKEYDDMLSELMHLETKFPHLKFPDSPTQRVGVKLPEGMATVRHLSKMFSLDNTYSIEELRDWGKRISTRLGKERLEFVVELKIDGVSANLIYKHGRLVLAATRGDGVRGEDITAAIKTVRSVPLLMRVSDKYALPSLLELRGEVFMNKDDFFALNADRKHKGEPVFANPRNAASGSIKLLDCRITAKRKLRCFIHSLGRYEWQGNSFHSQWDFLNIIREWGFPVARDSRLCVSIDEVIAYCIEYQKKRKEIPYEVDGVVVKVNLFEYQRSLGETMKSPRWAVAYKFPAHQVTTCVKRIVVQVGRTGILTPVAELEPVQCAGVVISRATLHNFDEVRRLGIKEGDRVLVERAGDVIPKIVKVVEHSNGSDKEFRVPDRCPVCGGKVAKEKQDDVAYYCLNPACPKQLEQRIIHFASRDAMDITGLGEAVVSQLVRQAKVKDIADLYGLKKEDLLSIDLFAEKKADNLITAIEKSKNRGLSRLLFGLGIHHVGEKVSALIARKFATIDYIMNATAEDFEQIPEIGKVIAASLEEYFRQPQVRDMIKRMREYGVNMQEPDSNLSEGRLQAELAGKKFVFTGELQKMRRRDAQNLVVSLGGIVSSSVSRKTDFVVVGDSPGSKYREALRLGVKLLDESEFLDMIDRAKKR